MQSCELPTVGQAESATSNGEHAAALTARCNSIVRARSAEMTRMVAMDYFLRASRWAYEMHDALLQANAMHALALERTDSGEYAEAIALLLGMSKLLDGVSSSSHGHDKGRREM